MNEIKKRENIEIFGAAENNLKHINVTIPKEKLVIFAGVSGSGKSSLAFDTIAAESNRQWQASYPMFLRQRLPRYEKPKADAMYNLTPAIVVDQKALGANVRSTVGTAVDVAPLIRLLFSRVGQPSAGGSMAYSLNHPHGMCPECTGLGEKVMLDESKLFDMDKSINEGAIRFSQFSGGSWQEFYYKFNPLYSADKKLRDFTKQEWKALRIGPDEPLVMDFIRNNTGQVSKLPYEGVVTRFNRLYLNRDISKLRKSVREEVMQFIKKGPCSACGGSGLNPKALASKINGYTIRDYNDMQISDLIPVLEAIDHPLGKSIAGQILVCLHHMMDVGLGYLSLSRRTDTMSGGESQRLKMVRHLGSSLSNITYIFDEPTAGLHPADVQKIGKLLLALRDNHNTVLVVEHSRQMIELADHVVEMGPLAGAQGGQVIFQGTVEQLKQTDTLTAACMREKIALNTHPLPWTQSFVLEHVSRNNLKDVSVEIPEGILTAVTGVAGSGKSSLIRQEFVDVVVRSLGHVEFAGRNVEKGHTRGLPAEVNRSQVDVFLVGQKVVAQNDARRNQLDDAPLDESFHQLGVFQLFADRHALPCPHQLGQVGVDGVVGESRQLDEGRRPVGAAGERDAQNPAGLDRIVAERLVEIAHAEEQDRIGVNRLDLVVLLHQRSLYIFLIRTCHNHAIKYTMCSAK